MGDVRFTREEPYERPTLLSDVVADGSAQNRELVFESVKHSHLGDWGFDYHLYFAGHPGKRLQVRREHDPDHGRLCTSIESTAGKSLAMAIQESPESDET